MNEQNIWENLNFSEDNLKNVYDYLIPQIDNFEKATKSELLMEVEAIQSESSDSQKRQMVIYTLSIIAPHMGNFRKKILHIAEFEDQGHFPVNIYCYIDDSFLKDIAEKDFLINIKGILSKNFIKNTIENLYRQSVQSRKKN